MRTPSARCASSSARRRPTSSWPSSPMPTPRSPRTPDAASASTERRAPGRPSPRRRDVDLVCVALPNFQHRPAVEAILAGRQARAVRETAGQQSRRRRGHARSGRARRRGAWRRLQPAPRAGDRGAASGHRAGRGRVDLSVQWPLPDRLRREPRGALHLALRAQPGRLGRAGRYRQPPDRPEPLPGG